MLPPSGTPVKEGQKPVRPQIVQRTYCLIAKNSLFIYSNSNMQLGVCQYIGNLKELSQDSATRDIAKSVYGNIR
jgi:hypothetical protein